MNRELQERSARVEALLDEFRAAGTRGRWSSRRSSSGH